MKQALATDLDGTLIPIDNNSEHLSDLQQLADLAAQSAFELVFVTGRHFESVADAIETYQLPLPRWIICDVGTNLLHWSESEQFLRVQEYRVELASLVENFPLDRLQESLQDLSGLRLQESEKQGEFKLSFYCDADELQTCSQEIQRRVLAREAPYSLVCSTDPFENVGLLDLLPQGVSKAYALDWWTTFTKHDRERVVFAGDSGNDTAALTAGYRSIVVGNAHQSVVSEVRSVHQERGTSERLYIADRTATSGVLEGCRHFGLI